MNYQHAYHAGNFADLFKHAVLLALLDDLRRSPRPFTAIDSHAGAGVYDLESKEARRTGEGAAALRLMSAPDVPPALRPLREAIRRLNRGGPVRRYPGSPWLIAEALRGGDHALACEANVAAAGELRQALAPFRRLNTATGDGWLTAIRRAPPAPSPLIVLIDPPFEAGDDGARAAEALDGILSRNPAAIVAVWAPIKDLAGFDGLACDLEDGAGACAVMVGEVRLRALDDPMRMNGCAMVVANPPLGLAEVAREAGQWIVSNLGEAGGGVEVRQSPQAPDGR